MSTHTPTPAPPLYTPHGGQLPRMALVRQHFDTTRIPDIRAAVAAGFRQHAPGTIEPGMRVAITAGSRGIANIAGIIAAVADEVRLLGAEPFVIAAMGSHGGATAEGQREVLQSYGVTEDQVGCPVVTTTEVVPLGETDAGVTAYTNRIAHEADAIILLNRVKPHTILTGELGSGLMKIAAVGLGNPMGADSIHHMGLQQHVIPVARLVLQRAPIKLGVAIVENSLDQTWKIETIPTAAIEEADKRLLREARALLPNIPFDPLDLLIVDQIGKNFAGTGMDPNVIGMHRRIGGPPQREIGCIVACDLSDESHGNASGVGMADVITEQLRAKIDWHATYTNGLTANNFGGVKLPVACASARAAVLLAMKPYNAESIRVVRVRNTAQLDEMWVSQALLAEIASRPSLEQIGDLQEVNF
ncbi:MAG TPA: lactate racemase domain-containing protein [Roseiflexaceae bacterium]|jgi:hypothetical protein|nr:lactate racemase domain-containing protein [Roseiflexaceae bacterium]